MCKIILHCHNLYTQVITLALAQYSLLSKYLLKKLLARYVPRELFDRPKMGFGVPIDSWLRGPLKALLLDYLSAERLKKEGLFNETILNQKIHEHLRGQCNHHYRLWAVLMWEMWRERWLT